MLILNLKATSWTLRFSARMGDSPLSSLSANCRVEKASEVIIDSGFQLENSLVDLFIGSTYSKPEPPKIVKQRDSLMDLSLPPLGVVALIPDGDFLTCELYAGDLAPCS